MSTHQGRRLRGLVLVALPALVGLGIWALCTGAPALSPADLWPVLQDDGSVAHVVLVELRIPRLLLAVVGGAVLGIAGAVVQPALQNPLAGPELTGVAAGASLAVAVISVLHVDLPALLAPLVAAGAGLAAGLVVLLLTGVVDDPVRMALAGATVTAVLGALVVAVLTLGTAADTAALYRFLVGSLTDRRWADVQVALPAMVVGAVVLAAMTAPVNALRLGDTVAGSLGARPLRTRVVVLAATALATAGLVAVAGPIGYVALAVPHGVRRLLGTSDVRLVVVASGLCGAVVLVAADLAARLLIAPQELPVGLLTAAVGAPVAVAVGRARYARSTT